MTVADDLSLGTPVYVEAVRRAAALHDLAPPYVSLATWRHAISVSAYGAAGRDASIRMYEPGATIPLGQGLQATLALVLERLPRVPGYGRLTPEQRCRLSLQIARALTQHLPSLIQQRHEVVDNELAGRIPAARCPDCDEQLGAAVHSCPSPRVRLMSWLDWIVWTELRSWR